MLTELLLLRQSAAGAMAVSAACKPRPAGKNKKHYVCDYQRVFIRRDEHGRNPEKGHPHEFAVEGVSPRCGNLLRATLLAILICLATGAEGSSVGPTGYTNAFIAVPSPADWSTANIAGASGDVTTDTALDAAVQLLAAVASPRRLPLTLENRRLPPPWPPGVPPGSICTRPTGVKMAVLMATLVNNTGTNANVIDIGYDFTNATTVAEEILGHRVYYSLTGRRNWQNIPALNSPPSSKVSAMCLCLRPGIREPRFTCSGR